MEMENERERGGGKRETERERDLKITPHALSNVVLFPLLNSMFEWVLVSTFDTSPQNDLKFKT